MVISGIKENNSEWLLIKQFRRKKRSLREVIARKGRKEPNKTQKDVGEFLHVYIK